MKPATAGKVVQVIEMKHESYGYTGTFLTEDGSVYVVSLGRNASTGTWFNSWHKVNLEQT